MTPLPPAATPSGPSVPPAWPPAPASPSPDAAAPGTRATRRSVILWALLGGVLFDILVPGNATGLGVALVVGAFLLVAHVVAGREGWERMDAWDRWLAPSSFLLALLVVLRADGWLVAMDLFFAALLAAGTVACLGGARVTRGPVLHVIELSTGTAVSAVVGILSMRAGVAASSAAASSASGPASAPAAPGTAPSLRHRLGARLSTMAPVLRGLAIALPIVLVFGMLFSAADAVFAKLAADLFNWQLDLDLGDIIGRGFVVGIVTWGATGLLALGAGLLPAFLPSPRNTVLAASPSAPTSSATSVARLGSVEATTILVVVDLLFAVFVALQVAYLFGGRDTLASTGLTYAEYARRGFFELVVVAVLAGMLVVGLDVAAGAGRSRAQQACALLLLALTAVILGSALQRLGLYQAAYGWTELRFVVLASILWLAAGIVALVVLLHLRRTTWTLHVLGVGVLGALVLLNVVGPQAFVTERNLERALNPSLVPAGGRTGLDSEYLFQLGDEAIPAIVAAWSRLSPDDQAALESLLRHRRAVLTGIGSPVNPADDYGWEYADPELSDPAYYGGWAAFNVGRWQAAEALRSWQPGD